MHSKGILGKRLQSLGPSYRIWAANFSFRGLLFFTSHCSPTPQFWDVGEVSIDLLFLPSLIGEGNRDHRNKGKDRGRG